MLESVLAIVAALLGVAVWYVQRRAAQQDAAQPEREEAARDADLVDSDPRQLSVRLQRLLEQARRRRRPRQPPA